MKFLENMFKYEADGGNAGGGNPSDDNNNDDNNDNNDDKGNPSDDSKKADNMIPYERFKEVNDNFKSVKDELDKLKKDQEKAEENEKKEKGKYKELLDDLQPKHDALEEELKQYKNVFEETLKTELESVPEDYRDLVPDGSEVEKLRWVQNAKQKGLFKKEEPQSFGNQGNNPSNNNEVTQEEFNKMSYTERVKFQMENPELYKKLAK